MGNIKIPASEIRDPEFEKKIREATDIILPKPTPDPILEQAITPDPADEELAREVDASIPDPEPEFPPISADAIINRIKTERVALPGMAGKALGTLRDHEISMCIKRAAVKMGLPESRHYPVGVWGALEARSLQLVKDPTFVSRAEGLLLGFQRGWSAQSLAHVVIYWAFMQSLTEILLKDK